jgi:putative transposase
MPPCRHPIDETEFFLNFLPAVPQQIRRDGIHFCNIRYWDNVLSPWAGRLKQPLLVKCDPRNLSRIYMQDPDGRHWPIPYADLRQPPIALWEMEAARKQALQSGRSMNSEHAIFASILDNSCLFDGLILSPSSVAARRSCHLLRRPLRAVSRSA